jgi:hypothetical protein
MSSNVDPLDDDDYDMSGSGDDDMSGSADDNSDDPDDPDPLEGGSSKLLNYTSYVNQACGNNYLSEVSNCKLHKTRFRDVSSVKASLKYGRKRNNSICSHRLKGM